MQSREIDTVFLDAGGVLCHPSWARVADVLVRLARSVSLPKLRKHPRGPKKPKPKKQSGAEIKHVATAKILEGRHKCTK